MLRKLTAEECRLAIAEKEFPHEVVASSARVAVVLTQGWCPQWTWMQRYLGEAAVEHDVDIYWLAYDQESFFDEFVEFKETVFGNREIPYVRYYRNGALARTSNYIDKGGFLRYLRG